MQEGQYLGEDSVLAAGVQGRVVPVLHGQASVNVEPWHEVGLAGFRVLQTLGNESCALLGQQQELLDVLPTGMHKTCHLLPAEAIAPPGFSLSQGLPTQTHSRGQYLFPLCL